MSSSNGVGNGSGRQRCTVSSYSGRGACGMEEQSRRGRKV